jgi:ABC-type dipeptide/oligopeptide/nickel transport system permease subunit
MHNVNRTLGFIGWSVLAVFTLTALFAPWVAPHDPAALAEPMLPPSTLHPLGTNDIGQDILSELLHGARFSLLVGALAAGISTAVGIALGVVAGYYDRIGFALMRIVDVFLAVPRFPLIVFLAAFLKPGFWTLVLFFLLFGWPKTTRLVRAQVLSERHNGYVEAAVAVGVGDVRILTRHLLPGTLSIGLVRFIVEFQHVILAESGLSFLGLGDPTVKSWGTILHYAFQYPTIFISDVWIWWAAPPGICITLVALALTFVGFSLEAWANPQLNGRGG